jgi:DNA-binding transcriptional ArsR family regulator
MKNPIENLNKIFDSRIRLGIMSALMVNDEVNFNELKELIQVTDGNLASHLKTLEENEYVKVQKDLLDEKQIQPMQLQKLGKKPLKHTLSARANDKINELIFLFLHFEIQSPLSNKRQHSKS